MHGITFNTPYVQNRVNKIRFLKNLGFWVDEWGCDECLMMITSFKTSNVALKECGTSSVEGGDDDRNNVSKACCSQ